MSAYREAVREELAQELHQILRQTIAEILSLEMTEKVRGKWTLRLISEWHCLPDSVKAQLRAQTEGLLKALTELGLLDE